ncbi:MAG: hypothetical protein KDA34_05865 [Phycisphaerales bacterium]|nr:hypothetical protein [Phycisphaerales bacterium]
MKKKAKRNRKPPGPKQPLQSTAYQALMTELRARADELELSVRALAERLDRPRTTVHKTLCGQRRIDPVEFLDWCDALEIKDPVKAIRRARDA